jgi:peptidase E
MTSPLGKICIMGSGETAPTMVKVHRQLLEALPREKTAVFLDTPFGFQENADELAAKALEYFKVSLQTEFHVASFRSSELSSSYDREQFLNSVARANYIFAGPGSPTYALNNWHDIELGQVLKERVRNGATVTFSSAAALTLGASTLPVYEVYKVGSKPYWNDGLNLLDLLDIDAAVIPHYNNQEGGHHDTRFCYMGEQRLSYLETLLPESRYILGIDEHTGVIIDPTAHSVVVVGNGLLTLRKDGISKSYESGTELDLSELVSPQWTSSTAGQRRTNASGESVSETGVSTMVSTESSLSQQIEELSARFDASMSEQRAKDAVEAALDLDDLLFAWSADTLQSDDLTTGRKLLRAMILRLGEAAITGLRDPRDTIAPLVEGILDLRRSVRNDKDYKRSDEIRDLLTRNRIEVKDTPDGTVWELNEV